MFCVCVCVWNSELINNNNIKMNQMNSSFSKCFFFLFFYILNSLIEKKSKLNFRKNFLFSGGLLKKILKKFSCKKKNRNNSDYLVCKDSVDKEWLHCSSTWKMSPSPSHFRIQLKWFVFAHRQKKTNPKNKNKKMFPYLKQNSTSLTSKHLIPKKIVFSGYLI